jgi:hypothetical protein
MEYMNRMGDVGQEVLGPRALKMIKERRASLLIR